MLQTPLKDWLWVDVVFPCNMRANYALVSGKFTLISTEAKRLAFFVI